MLFAVHISDGILTLPWLVGGFVGAAALAVVGAWRIREEEIPRVALLTAAFFVASSIHVPVGPVRAHLLLNGLLGVVLGRRAGLAIPVGLAMQAALLPHAGYTTLGVTSCVMTIPALLAGQVFHALQRVPWLKRPPARSLLVAGAFLVFSLGVVNSVAWLTGNGYDSLADLFVLHPLTWVLVLGLSLLAAFLESRLENAPEFPLGLLLGELSVLVTVALNTAVLILGGERDWQVWALAQLVAHLPVAVIEGIVLGFTVSFLARVKPEMLGTAAAEEQT